MTSVAHAYDRWSGSYDRMENKTRDLDALALQTVLHSIAYGQILELGCGTGKNSLWLAQKAERLVAMDFSEGMLSKAKEKVVSDKVEWRKADITAPWELEGGRFDLACFNLVLEHIKDLTPVFAESARVLKKGSYLFACELHPVKQYLGSKARFEGEEGLVVPDCFIHHTSEYLTVARLAGFELVRFDEWFDKGDSPIPRLLSLLFKKQ